MVIALTALDQQIKSLAPVINSSGVSGLVNVTSSDNAVLVFAGRSDLDFVRTSSCTS